MMMDGLFKGKNIGQNQSKDENWQREESKTKKNTNPIRELKYSKYQRTRNIFKNYRIFYVMKYNNQKECFKRITDYFKVSLSISMLNWRVIFSYSIKALTEIVSINIYLYIYLHTGPRSLDLNHHIIKLGVILGERVRLEGIHTFWSVNKLMKNKLINTLEMFTFLFILSYLLSYASSLHLESRDIKEYKLKYSTLASIC